MLKFKTKKSDEVKTSPLTKKSNAVEKATMFFCNAHCNNVLLCCYSFCRR